MIYIIIPVFNRLELTQSCIKSIYSQKEDIDSNIILVDDGSSDRTVEWVSSHYPEVTILKGSGSLFWGGAIQKGVEHALKNCNPNDYVLLVNNDVILSENTIFELVNFCEKNNRKVLVGSISVDSRRNGRVIKSGTKVKSWFLNWTSHAFFEQKIEDVVNQKSTEVDFLTGRCLLHPVEVFLKAGNYDSISFSHYGADDEFSMRVKRYGFKTFLCTSAIVYMQETPSKNLRFFDTFFSIHSSSNIINKFKLSLKVAPLPAMFSFFIFGIIKSIIVSFKNVNK